MVRLGILILTALLSVLCNVKIMAQAPVDSVADGEPELRVSVVTCYPGPEIYQLYGHVAIRVRCADNDIVYNYGIFDFKEPNFVYRFVKGTANYMLAACPFDRFMWDYMVRQSKVVEQQLNISRETAMEIIGRLEENALPENRSYKYDYIKDNCATRPRDIIEQVIGETLTYAVPEDSVFTFRKIMQSYESHYPWQSFGIALALGGTLDKPIPYRDTFFAPLYLMKALAGATYVNGDGMRVPLVCETDVILPGADEGSILEKTPAIQTPLAFALFILLITVGVTLYSVKNNRVMRGFDAVIFSLYGIAGCIIYFLIFFSDHAATSPNLVGLWLNPFYFVPVILYFIKGSQKFLYCYQYINFALLLVLVLGGWCLPQYWDIAFYPLILALMARQLNYIIYYRKNEN